jgi:tRNA(fMet)-specific endonuclease VapC
MPKSYSIVEAKNHFTPLPNQNVLDQLQQHQYELAIAATVWHELWYGCQRLPASRRRSEIEKYLREIVEVSMPILSYDTQAAYWHATERARLTNLGLPPPFADGQVAAVAVVNQLVLVTNNGADYANFQGLQLVNWF